MKLAHISDLHVLSLDGVGWTRFINKRLTGLANLNTFRRHSHPLDVFDALTARLADSLDAGAIQHVVVTGDLSNLALESEFARARVGIAAMGDNSRVSVVPGNHDIYTKGSALRHRFEQYFGSWMGELPRTPGGGYEYPWTKRIYGVSLFGLCSAFPTPPLQSFGTVDAGQRQRLVHLARAAEHASNYKVVLVHHNLHSRGSRLKDRHSGMRDLNRLVDALFDADIQLVLHGHTHVAHRFELRRREKRIAVVGCGSSTWTHAEHPARFNIYEIAENRLCQVRCHIWDAEERQFLEQQDPLELEVIEEV